MDLALEFCCCGNLFRGFMSPSVGDDEETGFILWANTGEKTVMG